MEQLLGSRSGKPSGVLSNRFVSQPTIAVLRGLAFGGGCELALCCDLRVVEEQALIGLPEVKLGILPGARGTQRLPRLIGKAKAKKLMFTGDPVTAEEALRVGLVNAVSPKGKGMELGKELAKKFARYSLQALSRIKMAVDFGLDKPIESGLKKELELFDEVFGTEDAQEGVRAFWRNVSQRSAIDEPARPCICSGVRNSIKEEAKAKCKIREDRLMFVTRIRPRVSETDGVGHINNTTIPIWFESGRDEIFRLFTPDLSFRTMITKTSNTP